MSYCLFSCRYYHYTLSVNGVAEDHGSDYATDYLTDLITNRSCAFIAAHAVNNRTTTTNNNNNSGSSSSNNDDNNNDSISSSSSSTTTSKPFFVMVGTPASHEPDDYAPWTEGMFADAQGPRTPNWNAAPNADKHWMMRYVSHSPR